MGAYLFSVEVAEELRFVAKLVLAVRRRFALHAFDSQSRSLENESSFALPGCA